ncbi:MAG: carboxypeptidase-like regulatory domain-containing protein [Bacteroidia bacterium]|nr:carboxypeptidase-like regulatory domain-containing protein [Bacteroidia bacterium]
MRKLCILLLVSSFLLSCNRNGRVGVLVEVSGRVFTDSTHTVPVAGAEVALVEFSSFVFSRRYYDEDNTVLTDSQGNYSLTTISEEYESYAVWLKPDLFSSASASRVERLREWEPNVVDLHHVDPIMLKIELIGDSICEGGSLNEISGTLILEGEQQLDLFEFGYFIEEEIPLTWSQDTTISLFVGPGTSLIMELRPDSRSLTCTSYHGLVWNERRFPQVITDSMTIRLQRY